MDIGMLNLKITIQKQTTSADSLGNRTNTWTDYFTCRATGGQEGGAESDVAGQKVEASTISFTVRFSTETKAVNSSGYRIKFNSEIYNIISIDHNNFRRKSIKFNCKKVER